VRAAEPERPEDVRRRLAPTATPERPRDHNVTRAELARLLAQAERNATAWAEEDPPRRPLGEILMQNGQWQAAPPPPLALPRTRNPPARPFEREEEGGHEDVWDWTYCPRCNTFHGDGDHRVVSEDVMEAPGEEVLGEEAPGAEVLVGAHSDVTDNSHQRFLGPTTQVPEDPRTAIHEDSGQDIRMDSHGTHEAAAWQTYEDIRQDLREESSRDLQERILEHEGFLGSGGPGTSALSPGLESGETHGIKRSSESIVDAGCCSRATGGLCQRVRRFFGRKPKGARASAPAEGNQEAAPLPK